jgi:hypothetical protein
MIVKTGGKRQGAAMLRGREAVRADRRLHTDEKAIRMQLAILYKTPEPFLLLIKTVFWYGCLLSVPKHGSRAQRAMPLAGCDSIDSPAHICTDARRVACAGQSFPPTFADILKCLVQRDPGS